MAATPATQDDAAFAEKVLGVARTADKTPGLQAMLCQKAYEYGIRHVTGATAAGEAMKLLGAKNPRRLAACQEKLIAALDMRFRQGPPGGTAAGEKSMVGRELLDVLLTVAERKLRGHKPDEAEDLLRQAAGVAGLIDRSALARIHSRMRIAAYREQAGRRAAALAEAVAKDPGDARKRNDAVLLYVVDLDHAGEAAKLVAADMDERLRTYVPLAAQNGRDVSEASLLELADWYRDLSGRAGPVGRATALHKAKDYCDLYLAMHETVDAGQLKAKMILGDVQGEIGKLGLGYETDLAPLALSGEQVTAAKAKVKAAEAKKLAAAKAAARKSSSSKKRPSGPKGASKKPAAPKGEAGDVTWQGVSASPGAGKTGSAGKGSAGGKPGAGKAGPGDKGPAERKPLFSPDGINVPAVDAAFSPRGAAADAQRPGPAGVAPAAGPPQGMGGADGGTAEAKTQGRDAPGTHGRDARATPEAAAQAAAEAKRGREQVKKANAIGVLNLPQWQQAWWLALEARACYERAAGLDPQRPPALGELAALNSALERLGGMGVELLRLEAGKQKAAVVPLLVIVRKDEQGHWGPPAAVGRLNAAVEAVLKTRDQMKAVQAAASGAPPAAAAAMAKAVDQADRIDPPANLSAAGRQAFGELFPPAGGGHRLRPIGGGGG